MAQNERLEYINSVYVDIFMHMPQGAIIVNIEGKIKEVNLAAKDMMGKSLEDMKGKNISEYLGTQIPYTRAMLERPVLSGCGIVADRSKAEFTWVLSGIPFRNKEGEIRGG